MLCLLLHFGNASFWIISCLHCEAKSTFLQTRRHNILSRSQASRSMNCLCKQSRFSPLCCLSAPPSAGVPPPQRPQSKTITTLFSTLLRRTSSGFFLPVLLHGGRHLLLCKASYSKCPFHHRHSEGLYAQAQLHRNRHNHKSAF